MKCLYFLLLILMGACIQHPKYDTIIQNGMIYDGTGAAPFKGDIAINADTIAFIGDLKNVSAENEIDAGGKAIAPGFINVMGHSEKALF